MPAEAKRRIRNSHSIEKTIKRVSDGIEIANVTAEVLLTIIGGADKVADIISGISKTSQEQSGAIQQLYLI